MDKLDNGFNRYRTNTPNGVLGDDFEDRVFAKIKKKKQQRKVAASAALSIAVVGFIFVGQALFRGRGELPPEQLLAVGSEILVKEEVPVMEDVIFASSDAGADYAIEQVAYTGDNYSL